MNGEASQHDGNQDIQKISRRQFMEHAALLAATLAISPELSAHASGSDGMTDAHERFPYFLSTPVSSTKVQLQDTFWAPRQKTVRDVTVPWATRHYDEAGGLDAFRQDPSSYHTKIRIGDLEAIKFIEAIAAVVHQQRDAGMEGLVQAWGRKMEATTTPDGYWYFGWPLAADPANRWKAVWWSHEDYAVGHYLESGMEFRDATGDASIYKSAVHAVDSMAHTLLGSSRSYVPGHEEIEQALMRLYGATGNTTYLNLCGWLIAQRGHHNGRPSYGKYSQDQVPVEEQRTIEGHAVRAAFLYNGVTEYVGATGNAGYREAMLAVWDDLVQHKMYLHGAAGTRTTSNEGYSSKPYDIPPGDCYGESCSVYGNFKWAHNLFRLTGDGAYIDVAERMLYNAFYASLSLKGDRYYYENWAESDVPALRFAWHPVPCCPPNIVKLFAQIGGYFYSTDKDGVYVNHYGASEAEIPFGDGLKLAQRTNYPWDGAVTVEVTNPALREFTLRLRKPGWAKSHSLSINGEQIAVEPERGWLNIRRMWKTGDQVHLDLPMPVERITMPPQFKEYEGLVAIERGPIVYVLEEQDVEVPLQTNLYVPESTHFAVEHRADLLGGVTVLRADIKQADYFNGEDRTYPIMMVPYGVWNNRTPGSMRMWLTGQRIPDAEYMKSDSPNPPGDA